MDQFWNVLRLLEEQSLAEFEHNRIREELYQDCYRYYLMFLNKEFIRTTRSGTRRLLA